MEARANSQYRITEKEFYLLRDLIKSLTGINLSSQKKMLVVARLSKRLRLLGMDSFSSYYAYVTSSRAGAEELKHLINRMTTNKTDFYREAHHFAFMNEIALPRIYEAGSATGERNVRIWSAGCSSGEEPYTIAITLREFFKDKAGWGYRILATDLDTEILGRAQAGVYGTQVVAPIPGEHLHTYFKRGVGANDGLFLAKDTLKSLITFRRHNLVNDDPPVGRPVDMIFCRNVLIYFDEETRAQIIKRFHSSLRVGGYLFLGHSESLLGSEDDFSLIGNSIYQKDR